MDLAGLPSDVVSRPNITSLPVMMVVEPLLTYAISHLFLHFRTNRFSPARRLLHARCAYWLSVDLIFVIKRSMSRQCISDGWGSPLRHIVVDVDCRSSSTAARGVTGIHSKLWQNFLYTTGAFTIDNWLTEGCGTHISKSEWVAGRDETVIFPEPKTLDAKTWENIRKLDRFGSQRS
jgi:hypothetical protein